MPTSQKDAALGYIARKEEAPPVVLTFNDQHQMDYEVYFF